MLAWPMRLARTGGWESAAPTLPYGLAWLMPHQDGREFHWSVWQAVPGNSMLLAGLLLFAAGAAGYLRGLSIPLTGRIAEQGQRG